MADPFIGEIRMFGGDFAPNGWLFCDGQLLSIAQNDTLFALIGTTYGGDGQNTFAVPDLRGRVPVHQGSAVGSATRVIGSSGGSQQVALTVGQIPAHVHETLAARDGVRTQSPLGAVHAIGEADVDESRAEDRNHHRFDDGQREHRRDGGIDRVAAAHEHFVACERSCLLYTSPSPRD